MTPAFDMQSPTEVIEALGNAANALLSDRKRHGCHIQLPASGRLLVTGDLHDNPIHYQKILPLAKLDAGNDRHVVFQELIHSERLVNGVDLSHRMLLRIAELVLRFPGQVHPLLANHELSQLTGKGVSKGAGNSVELYDDGLAFVFGDDWEDVASALKELTRAMPLAVRSDSGVFCAHSIPAPRVMHLFDPTLLDRKLTDADFVSNEGSAYLMVWGRKHSDEQLATLAEAWQVKLFCLGHEHVDTGCEMFAPNLVRLNSDHEGAAVLPIDLSHIPTAEEAMMSGVRLGGF